MCPAQANSAPQLALVPPYSPPANGLDKSFDRPAKHQTRRRGAATGPANWPRGHHSLRCILERTSLRRGEPLFNQRKRRYVFGFHQLPRSSPRPLDSNQATIKMQAMLSDNSRNPPFYLQRSTSGHHDPNTHANLPGGAIANLAPGANINVEANGSAPPRRPGTSRRAAPSEDRPFACPVPNCGGRFHRKFTLHEHLKTHTGEQPHQCPVAECGKRFSTSGNLARHRKLHAMRKISCPAAHCTRVFTSREKLVPHLKVHLARTPHTCDFAGCGKTFSTAGNLTRHRRTQHRAGPSTRQEVVSVQLPPGPVPTLPRPKFEFPGRSAPPPTGSLPMRGLLWPSQQQAEQQHSQQQHSQQQHPQQHPPQQRILESDVQDLFDCLFVENAQAAAAAAANGHHNVAIIRDRLPRLEPPRDHRPPQQQSQAPYLTATYEF